MINAVATFAFLVVAFLEYRHLSVISSAPTKVKVSVSFFFGLIVAICIIGIHNIATN